MTPAHDPATLVRNRRVLVVEDDVVNLTFLRIILEKRGYQIFPAGDIKTAQEVFKHWGADHFDSVITDHWLPDQTGLDFLRWLKTEDPSLGTVMLTNEQDRTVITESLRLGVTDYLEKPVSAQKLLAAIEKAGRQTERQRHMNQSESAVEGLGHIQRRMVRSVETKMIELCFHPKFEAGGDFLSRFEHQQDGFCCLLSDVSGHDPQASYISTYFHGIFRGMSAQAASPEKILHHFNDFLVQEWNRTGQRHEDCVNTSVAAIALLVDLHHQTADVLINGAAVPVLVQSDNRAHWMSDTGSAPLGWFADTEINPTRHSIAGGGTIYLWTDGLDDLAETEGVHPLCLAFALQEAGRNHVPHPALRQANDDILFAAVLLPSNDLLVGFFQPIFLENYRGDQAPEIDLLAARWQRNLKLAAPQLTDDTEYNILLATREAVLNAMHHGCQGMASQSVRFQISYHRLDNFFRVWVEDPGPGHYFDFAAHETALTHKLGDQHRGLIYINHLAHPVVTERNGATLIMDFPLC